MPHYKELSTIGNSALHYDSIETLRGKRSSSSTFIKAIVFMKKDWQNKKIAILFPFGEYLFLHSFERKVLCFKVCCRDFPKGFYALVTNLPVTIFHQYAYNFLKRSFLIYNVHGQKENSVRLLAISNGFAL